MTAGILGLPELSLGWQVIHWIETLLCHGPGDVEGTPVELDTDLAAATIRAYSIDPVSGRRLVRRYVMSRPKGRAKSEWAGLLVCAEALGPVRFGHWAARGETSWWGYEYETGEPVGVPVLRPFIRVMATEENQSGNTYDNVSFIFSSATARIAAEVPNIDVGLTRTFLPGGGEIRPSTASNSSKDGGKETFAVFDETHLYTLPELRRMHSTVLRNLPKRKAAEGWALETTTMYELGAGSVAETTFDAVGKNPRLSIVLDHRQGPDPESFDWDDDRQLEGALRQAYAPGDWMDFAGIIDIIRDPEMDKADAVRFYLNRSHAAAADVIDLADWDRLARPGETIEAATPILVAFDGSDVNDSTGLLIIRASDGFTSVAGLWEPAGKGWRVPRAEVHATVAELFATFKVLLMYADRSRWETDLDEWAGRYGEKVVLAFPQSDVRLWEAGKRLATIVKAAVGALDRGEDAELTFAEQISHDGNPDLRRHVGNATRLRVGGRGSQSGRWKSAKKKPHLKIDLLRCAEMGHKARGDAIARGLIGESESDPMVNIW